MAMEAHEIEAVIRGAFPDATITITDLAGTETTIRPR